MKLIIGLGNPGINYKNTRHNVGFMALDMIASSLSSFTKASEGKQTKFNAEISEGLIDGEKIILAKPQTFMNESGASVKAIIDYYKIPTENITVIHDDLDILLGEYRIARNRGSAGHKGAQSIIDALGTKDFTRIRIGIKPLDFLTERGGSLDSLRSLGTKQIPVREFVLENFTKEEQKIIDEIIEKVCDVIPNLFRDLKK